MRAPKPSWGKLSGEQEQISNSIWKHNRNSQSEATSVALVYLQKNNYSSPTPLLWWRILFEPVSAALRIKARGWEGKVWKDVAPLLRPGIYLRLWHSKISVTASRTGREANSLCSNKEQRTETEWGKGSHSLCRSALWPLHSARVASTFTNLENAADVISLCQQRKKNIIMKKKTLCNPQSATKSSVNKSVLFKSMLLWYWCPP